MIHILQSSLAKLNSHAMTVSDPWSDALRSWISVGICSSMLGHDTTGWFLPHLLHTCRCRQWGYVQRLPFHSRHGSPDGWIDPPALTCLPAKASTTVSIAFSQVGNSGSGFPLCVTQQLCGMWQKAKFPTGNGLRASCKALCVQRCIDLGPGSISSQRCLSTKTSVIPDPG